MRDITLILVGDELLEGDVADRNGLFAASFLREKGFPVTRIVSVRDEVSRISEAIKEAAFGEPGILIISGGLGPTVDDRTREGLSVAAGVPLEEYPAARRMVEDYYRKVDPATGFPRNLPAGGERQYLIPAGGEPVVNGVGVAPGFRIRIGDNLVFAVPGVPREFAWILEHVIVPHLSDNTEPENTGRRFLRTTGITESRLFEKVRHLLEPVARVKVSFLPSPAGVDIVFKTGKDLSGGGLEEIDSLAAAFEKLLSQYVYSRTAESMEQILRALLIERGLTLALAESCTGGLTASRFTDVPGSSSCFILGVVTYSNESKEKLLGVPSSILEAFGAVSSETAKAMSGGLRGLSGADIALSITGVAGPDGGTDEKPVGSVYFSLCSADVHFSVKRLFRGDRNGIKFRSSQTAFDIVRRFLLELPIDSEPEV